MENQALSVQDEDKETFWVYFRPENDLELYNNQKDVLEWQFLKKRNSRNRIKKAVSNYQ